MQELLHNFGINGKLLLAQVVNFGILFYVLRRFAYGPIVSMLEERRRRIKRGLEDSAEAERRLKDVKVREAEVIEEAQAKGSHLVAHAEEVARKKEASIVDGAHGKAEAIIAGAQKVIADERERQVDEVKKDAESLIALATAKTLGKMELSERDAELVRQALAELRTASNKGL